MRSSREYSTLGDKLGPKLIAAITQSVIATKKGLMPTEHKLRVSAMQSVIDTAGMEVAEHIRPLLNAAIKENPELHPLVASYLDRTASGRNQLQAIAGHMAIGAAGGALSTMLNNELAPLSYSIVQSNPHLRLDPQTAAAAAATGLWNFDSAYNEARAQGLDNTRIGILTELAAAIPDARTIGEMVNRGFLTEQSGNYWIQRGGYGQSLHGPLMNLRRGLITVADAALAVLRGNIDMQEGERIAAENGFDTASFRLLVLNTGEPPGLQQLDEAYRRGFIDRQRLVRGIRQSRVRDEWIDVVEALRYSPMSAADAIEANVKGYLTENEARAYAEQSGLEPRAFEPMRLAAGEPLSRTEMADLVNRGEATIEQFDAAIRQSRVKDAYVGLAGKLIERPMTIGDAVRGYVQGYLSEAEADRIQGMNGLRAEDRKVVREIDGIPLSLTEMLRLMRMGKMTKAEVIQGLRESRLKDKYVPFALDLGVYLPSIFELRLMLRDGAITDAQAAKILLEHGYEPDIVKGIIHAFGSSSTGAAKTVTEGMLTDLYLESVITRQEYLSLLHSLGYSEKQAELVAEVADWRIDLQSRTALISRIRLEYVGRHISETEAETQLYNASIPHQVIARVMAEWNAELKVTIKILTAAQVADAWHLGLFDPADTAANTTAAIKYLNRLAYNDSDATKLLEIKNKGPLNA